MYSVTYSFGDVYITINTLSMELVELIEKDTLPYFIKKKIVPSNSKHIEINFYSSSKENLKIPLTCEKILLHPRDTPLYGSVWYEDGYKYIYNPHYPSIYRLSDLKAEVIYTGEIFNAFIGFRLLISPIIYRLSDTTGSITFHASSVERNSSAFMFCGPKGAGKTSTALSLVFLNNYNFMANEYTTIYMQNDWPFVLGTPEAIRIGDGTYNAFFNQLSYYTSGESVNSKQVIHLRDIKKRINICNSSQLKKIFFVELYSDCSNSCSRVVDLGEAEEKLYKNSMEIEKYRTPQLWDYHLLIEEKDIRSHVKDLVSKVESYNLIISHNRLLDMNLTGMIE